MDKSALIDKIKQNLHTNIDSQADIKIIDETYKHTKHKGYVEGKYHLLLEINSDKLNAMSKISAHKNIYNTVNELMPYIHALSIKLKSEQS